MGTKHDILTECELRSFSMNIVVGRELERMAAGLGPAFPKSCINVLDWGCGRGRTVARLREDGFNAYGVDVDEGVLRNGYSLFEGRGLNPRQLLLPVDRTQQFPDGFFHLIFSEQVFEHVEDLGSVIREISRLTKPGGYGVHCFPGSLNVVEGHLYMPVVHWLPKNRIRRIAIALLMSLGVEPDPPWPEARQQPFWRRVEVYSGYLNRHTHYRDIETACAVAGGNGLLARYDASGMQSARRKWMPRALRRNAFPSGSIRLFLAKKSAS